MPNLETFNHHTDVLIVGAGPVGLTTAIILAHFGVNFTIIDKGNLTLDKSKAMTITPRTLELLNIIGVADELVSRGVPAYVMNYYYKQWFLGRADFKSLKSKYNFILQLPQAITVEILQDKLKQLGVHVNAPLEFKSMNKLPGFIDCQILNKSNQKMINYKTNYLIACDGGRSTIRENDGMLFEGDKSEDSFVMADISMNNFPYPFNERHIFYLPGESFVAVLPITKKNAITTYRIITTAKAGEQFDEQSILIKLKQQMNLLKLKRVELFNPGWVSQFNPKQFVVSNFCSDNIFYAGDAAHIQSPIGSQGLNTGIQDAFNLSWKLALVTRHLASPDLLQTYHAERYPIALNLFDYNNKISNTVFGYAKFSRKMMIAKKTLHCFVNYNKTEILNMSQIKINYRQHYLPQSSCLSSPTLSIGDRLPNIRLSHQKTLYDLLTVNQFTCVILTCHYPSDDIINKLQSIDDCLFNLILISYINEKLISNQRVVLIHDHNNKIHEEFIISEPALFMVRPDAYIYEITKGYENFNRALKLAEPNSFHITNLK